MKCVVMFLVLFCVVSTWADTPVRITYSDPVTEFSTEETVNGYSARVAVEKVKDSVVVKVSVRGPRNKYDPWEMYETFMQEAKIVGPNEIRALHRALGRALARLDSLEVIGKMGKK